jgi:dienelactone hydrolase
VEILELIVDPADGLVDELPLVRVRDAPHGVPITLTVQTTDAAGHRWRSVTELREDGDSTAAWWSMEFSSNDQAPVAFVAPPDRLDYELRAVAGETTATATATRRWANGPAPEVIDGEGFRLTIFGPAGGASRPGALVVPGSTGTATVLPRTALLAAHGYTAGVLSYMGDPGLPSSLQEIPLEAIAAGYRAFASHRTVLADRVIVLAASVGTGGVFAALASFSELDPQGVVAIAPTHVVWQSLGDGGGAPPKTSSWTLAGAALPWVAIRGERLLPEIVRHAVVKRFRRHPVSTALHLRTAYAAGLRDVDATRAATIGVERIRCPMLLLSGEDDQMWPASEMAAAVIARRERADDRHLSFPKAGHFLGPPFTPTTVPWNDSLVSGGTAAGNARAQADGWQAILSFLEDRATSSVSRGSSA